jgi:acyl homoserine lactone synthase
MLRVEQGTCAQLRTGVEAELAEYRYHVFVETLGWSLPCEQGIEHDQFDGPDTVYVVARDVTGSICGCARLLPTTTPYLLANVFPQLLGGMAAPKDAQVWELSRFSTHVMGRSLGALSREEARSRFCALLAAVVRTAAERGATRLITFTAVGAERILRTIGLHAHRVATPQLIAGQPLMALWIELDEQTRKALGLA